MAIKARDAIRIAREQIGVPYGSRPGELDCINLIKLVIRTAPGGVKGYTTAGTNALWKSAEAASKYRDLTWRQQGIKDAAAGMIAFKADGSDVHHAGIVTDAGTVIHASSARGMVVETVLSAAEGWSLLAVHRYIEADEEADIVTENVLFKAAVDVGEGSTLNLREEPRLGAMVIEAMPRGAVVEVLEKAGGWWRVRYKGETGWASEEYLSRVPDEVATMYAPSLTIVDGAGHRFYPVGGFTVIIGEDSVD